MRGIDDFMKSFIVLLLTVLSSLGAVVLPIQHNQFTTNAETAASNAVYSIAVTAVGSSTNTIIIDNSGTNGLQDFTIAQFGDLQKAYDTATGREYLTNSISWLIANATALNLKAVVTDGDLVDVYNSAPRWAFITNQLGRLPAASIPWYPNAGNHDYANDVHDDYNQHLSPYIPHQSGYISCLAPGDFYAAAWAQTNSGVKMLFISMGYTTNATDFTNLCTFATSVAAQYPTHLVLINTHAYLSSDGIVLAPPDSHYYAGTTGQDLWTNCFQRMVNACEVFCGHDWPGSYAHGTQWGLAGNQLDSFFVNFQDSPVCALSN